MITPKASPGPELHGHFRTEHLATDLSGRTVRGSAIMVIGQGVKFIITMIATVVLARLLTPQDYGLIGMVVVVTGFIALFKNLGLSTVMVQRADLTHEQVSALFWINMLLSIALTAATLLLAPAVAWFYHETRLTFITAAFAVGFILSGLSAQHEGLLRRQMRFVVLVVIELVAMITGFVTAIVLAHRGVGFWALVVNQLAFAGLYTLGVWLFCSWRPGIPTRGSGIRTLLAFGRDLTGYNVLNYFTRNLDNVLIGKFWGAQQLGVYAKAYQLLLLPLDQLGVPLDGIALAALSRLADAESRYRQAYLRMLEKIAMVSMPGIAFMAATSDWLVALLLGSQWTQAAPIFAALALMGIFEPAANTMGWLMISQGRSRHVLHWGIINSAITVTSFAIGLPWGALGVAVSFSVIGAFVRIPLLFWFACRVGPIRATDIYRTITVPLVTGVGVVGSLMLFRHLVSVTSAFVGLTVSLLIAMMFTLVVYLITPQGRAGIADFQSMLRQALRRAA